MSKSSYITALVAALIFGAAAAGPAVSQPRLCSNAPKFHTPCPNPHVPDQPIVRNAG